MGGPELRTYGCGLRDPERLKLQGQMVCFPVPDRRKDYSGALHTSEAVV